MNAIHSIMFGREYRIFYENYGSIQSSWITLEPNKPLTIEAEWNFTGQNVAKDWSIIAWAATDCGEDPIELSLKHNEGHKSDRLPYIERIDGEMIFDVPESIDYAAAWEEH